MSAAPAESPQAGAGATPQAGTPTTPQTPQAGKSDALEGLTPTELAQMVRDLRKESAGHRTKLTAFEREAEQRRQAELSEVEKRDARIRELEEANRGHESRARDYALRDAIAEAVTADDFPAAPVASTARIIRLIDPEQVQWGDDGKPRNVATLLAGLVRSDPYLWRAKDRRPGPADAGLGGAAVAADFNAQIRRDAGRG